MGIPEFARRAQPLEWNELEEKRTKSFFDEFIPKSKNANSCERDIFQVMEENGELDYGDLNIWTQQELEMNVIKERIRMLQRELLRIWCEADCWPHWQGMSSGRREALMIYALIDVEDMNELNLQGRRQLCPELVIKDLAKDPTLLIHLLLRCTATTTGKIALPSHPLVDTFLGLPKTLSWAYANIGQAMYAQSVLVSRSWYLTMFLVAVALRVAERPLSTSLDNVTSPPICCINPAVLSCSSDEEGSYISPPSRPKPDDLESLSHRFSRCTGCMNGLVDGVVWCMSCADVQYCSLECQDADLGEHVKTCGRKRKLMNFDDVFECYERGYNIAGSRVGVWKSICK